jgi:hypothetical protein
MSAREPHELLIERLAQRHRLLGPVANVEKATNVAHEVRVADCKFVSIGELLPCC